MIQSNKLAGFLLLTLLAAAPVGAQPMGEWFGLATAPGSVAEFGTVSLSTIPSDFFGPGSDPFDGQVNFGPANNDLSAIENMLRLFFPEPPMSPIDPLLHERTIPTLVDEMRLTSYQPAIVYFNGGMNSEPWDVEVSLSTVDPPEGQTTATKVHHNGGTFHTYLLVQPRFEFTRQSDGQAVVWDTGLQGEPAVELVLGGGRFVHDVDPLLHLLAEHNGLYVGGVEELNPGDPASQCPALVVAASPGGGLILELEPMDDRIQPDAYITVPGDEPGGTFFIFEGGDNPPMPAGFFGPGSDPFGGGVPMTGDPLGPTPWGDFEDADTLLRRLNHPFDRCDVPSAEHRVASLELLALNLRSLNPITVTYNGGQFPELWDLQYRLEPGGFRDGYLAAYKTHPNGGFYNMTLYFQQRLIFTRRIDGYIVIEDASVSGRPMPYLECTDGQWVHFANPGLHQLTPSQGRFVPCISEAVPGDLGSQVESPQHGIEYYGTGTLTLQLARRDMSPAPLPAARTVELSVYPNPFNPMTTINFELKREGPAVLRILDLRGQVVRTLVHEILPAGKQQVAWQARDDAGHRVASGVYFGVLETREGVRSCKLAVVK